MAVLNRALIESAAKGNPLDRRTLYLAFFNTLQMLCAATGTNLPAPTGSPQQPITAPPAVGAFSVTGANGTATIQIMPAATSLNRPVYQEVSFSTSSNFSTGVTVLPVSTSTHLTYPMPGQSVYWRFRSSFDQVNWNGYTYQPGLVAAGLQTSAANSAATSLNITNYATVDSVPNGLGTANVRVYGAAGPGTMFVGVKGTTETVYPAAVIINQTPGTKPYVAYDGEQFLVKATLPQVFGDDVVPVGQVGVVPGGSVTLPTVVAVTDGAGHVAGYNVTSPGANITADLSFAIGGPGTGATTGPQTITGGQLISVGPGAPGTGYASVPTVTPSGGVSPGTPGGGTATGNNGGRYTAIQGNG